MNNDTIANILLTTILPGNFVLAMFLGMCLELPQPRDLPRNNQVFVLAQRDAVFRSQPLSPFTDKVHVRTLAQDLPRCPHRVGNVLHAPHSSSAQGGAIHDQRVQLYLAIAVEKASTPGVKGLVIFHDNDRLFDRVQRQPTAAQHTPARGHG